MGDGSIKVTFLTQELLSSYLHNSNFFYQKFARPMTWVCVSFRKSQLRDTWACLFSETNSELEYVRWRTSRLYSMLSRRSSCINTSLSGLCLLYTNLLRGLPKGETVFRMSLLCSFFQNQYSNTPWFFRSGTQNRLLALECAGCCFAPRLKEKSGLCCDVLRLGWAATWACSKMLKRIWKRAMRYEHAVSRENKRTRSDRHVSEGALAVS